MSYKKNEWKNGDEITASKLNHMENGIAEASNESGTAGLTSVFGADIDKIENISRSLVLYIRDGYEHAPFDYGLIITHSYPDMAFFSGPKFEQLAISLNVGTKGKCYARTVAPLEDEAEGTYAPTSDDWHEVSYTKDEIDALLVREIDLTICSTVTTGTPTITSNSIEADDAIISVAASGKVEIEANVQHGASGSLTINGVRHSVTYGAPFTFSGTVEGPILVGVGFGKLTFDKFTTTGDYMLETRVTALEEKNGDVDAALDAIIELQESLINGTAVASTSEEPEGGAEE